MALHNEIRIYYFRGTLCTFKCMIVSPTREAAIEMAYEQYRRVTGKNTYSYLEDDEVVLEKSEPVTDRCTTILVHYTV